MVERETADTSNSPEAIETAPKLPLAKKRKITVIVIVSALIVILLLATLGTSRSSGKSHNIQGTYVLSNVIYKDYDLGPQGTSYITVQNRSSNPLCTYYLRVDTLETELSGYLSAGEAFVYDLKDRFSARQNAVIELQKGDNGSVTAVIENTTYTSAKDGSVKQRINKRTYEYGDNGEITASTYSSDGKVDHITTFTYDENGNILCYSNADPKTGKVYLKVTFTYTMADKDSVTEIDVDSFTTVYNWETIINFIL